MVRCFVGILIQDRLRNEIEKIKDELRKLPMKCKFVERENLHLCFSFLGEIEEMKIQKIEETLNIISKDFSIFEVEVNDIKTIPSEKYVRVLALDIIDKTKTLEKMIKAIKEKIGGDAKPPHLTLCRVKRLEDKEKTIEKIKEIKADFSLQISSIQLIKSELRRTGPIYTNIHQANLS